jgi:hypothetical protein
MHVASLQRAHAGVAKSPPRIFGERLRPPVGLAELGAQAIRLLEVVAGELVDVPG